MIPTHTPIEEFRGMIVNCSSNTTASCLKRTLGVISSLEFCIPYSRKEFFQTGGNKAFTNASVLVLTKENLKFGKNKSFLIY